MKKVLQISMGEAFGGIERLELDYTKYFDKDINLDILVPNEKVFKDVNETKIINNNIYNLSATRKRAKGRIIYDFKLYKFLKKNKYDIIHINSAAFLFSFRVALIAKICKVKKIVVHSHAIYNVNILKKIIISFLNPLYRWLTDEYLSCSEEAKKSLFTQKFIDKNTIKIIKDGIDVDKYRFNENTRSELRKKFNLEGKIIYGHSGRFCVEKNHNALIDIFNEIQKQQENSILILLGEGELKKEIQEKVNELGISNKVIFLGFKDNVCDILNCMDIFIFPSLSEGLGISVIEAQTNGIITYCSTNIAEEANISPKFKYFNLKESSYDIAKRICNEKLDLNNRKEAYKYTIKNGYDIKDVCRNLKRIYEGEK